VTSDDREFLTLEEAQEHKNDLTQVIDKTIKHDFQIGEKVFICSRQRIWECVFEAEEIEVSDHFWSDAEEKYIRAKVNWLVFKSVTDPDETEFVFECERELKNISRNIQDLLKIKGRVTFHASESEVG